MLLNSWSAFQLFLLCEVTGLTAQNLLPTGLLVRMYMYACKVVNI